MGILNNKENERFDFTLTVNVKSAGDFGAVRIGGVYRSMEDCRYVAEEMIDQIKRHVDNVDSVFYTIQDVWQEYEDVCDWKYNQSLKGKTWEEQEKLLIPKKDELEEIDNKLQDALVENDQLKAEIVKLKEQISNYGWEASARHAQNTGGWQ